MDQEQADQMCLDSYRFMRPVLSSCGHVTEIHYNNELMQTEHFEPMLQHVCAWCQLVNMPGIPPENLAHLLAKDHLHVNLYGEVCAFKVSTLTMDEWDAVNDIEQMFKAEGFTGFDQLED